MCCLTWSGWMSARPEALLARPWQLLPLTASGAYPRQCGPPQMGSCAIGDEGDECRLQQVM